MCVFVCFVCVCVSVPVCLCLFVPVFLNVGVNDSVWCTDKCVSSAKSEPVKVVPKMRIGTATPSIACIHVSVHGCMCGLCVWVSVCVRRGGGERANRGCDSVSKSVIVCVRVLVKKVIQCARKNL